MGASMKLHVTDILRIAGARKPIPKSEEETKWYLTRGKMIHRATELLDTAGLDWAQIADEWREEIRPYVEGYIKFRKEVKGKLVACECRLESQTMGFVGTIDRVFRDLGGVPGVYIVDLKTNDWDTATKWQLAAYSYLYVKHNRLRKPPFIRALALKDDGTYRLGTEWDNTKLLFHEFVLLKAVAQVLLANGLAKQEERE